MKRTERNPEKRNPEERNGVTSSFRRKKGAIIVEFIAVIPFFILIVWGIVQSVLFILSESTVHEAASQSILAITDELRGYGSMEQCGYEQTCDITASLQGSLDQLIYDKIEGATSTNGFVWLLEDPSNFVQGSTAFVTEQTFANDITYGTTPCSPPVSMTAPVICVTESQIPITDNAGQETNIVQYTIQIWAKYRAFGSFIPNWDTYAGAPVLSATATGIADLTDRYNYYNFKTT